MQAYLTKAQIPDLADWGTPEDIGARTQSGGVRVFGRIDLGSTEQPVFGGLFAAPRAVYRVDYPFPEYATVLHGEVQLTDEAMGESQLYRVGDSWIIKKETPVRWEIKSDKVVKSFVATTVDCGNGPRA